MSEFVPFQDGDYQKGLFKCGRCRIRKAFWMKQIFEGAITVLCDFCYVGITPKRKKIKVKP